MLLLLLQQVEINEMWQGQEAEQVPAATVQWH